MSQSSAPAQNASTDYCRPRELGAALDFLASVGSATKLCGGTDVYPAAGPHPLQGPVIDLSAVREMRGISSDETGWRIGGSVTWSEIARHDFPPAFEALKQAAMQVGSVQIQNRGSIAGNLCNASPAADGVPPLKVLDAVVEIASTRGTRLLPLEQFITGYRKTALAADELLTAIRIPSPPHGSHSSFTKLGTRKYLVISILMTAALIDVDRRGIIRTVRVAVGSASDKAQRLPQVEQALLGQSASAPLEQLVLPAHFTSLKPISDVRASAWYRQTASCSLVIDNLAKGLKAASHG